MIDADTLLRACFERARAHPFYHDHLAGADDHRNAPVSDKAVLKPHLDGFAPGLEGRGVYLVRSGGSTSTPLVFPVDIAENHAQRQALAAMLLADGLFDPRSVALNLFGYADLYRTAAILDDLLERCGATSLPMSAHARYEDMLAMARRFAPTHLLGTPSKLQLLADFLDRAGERLDLLLAGRAESCHPDRIATALAGIMGDLPPRAEVAARWVPMATLYQDPVTTKVPPIADFRR